MACVQVELKQPRMNSLYGDKNMKRVIARNHPFFGSLGFLVTYINMWRILVIALNSDRTPMAIAP